MRSAIDGRYAPVAKVDARGCAELKFALFITLFCQSGCATFILGAFYHFVLPERVFHSHIYIGL
jgi:hypothetical protein